MKVEIKGGTVALLVMDDTHERSRNGALSAATEMAGAALRFVFQAPTGEQLVAWRSLSEADREAAAYACQANVPAVLVIEDGKWSVRRDTVTINWKPPGVT